MIIEMLQKEAALKFFISQGLEIIYLDRPGLRLLEMMKNADSVFLIDAVKSNSAFGTLHRLEKEAIIETCSAISSHDLGVAETVSLGQALDMLPNRLVLYGLEVGEVNGFDINAQREEILNAAKRALIRKLTQEIESVLFFFHK